MGTDSSRRGSRMEITAKGLRLLLVEDDLDSGPALKAMLERRGGSVHLVTSGEDATKVFAASDFDAVVADIRLGGMSGVDLLAWIRERDKAFPVILLTGFDSLTSAIQAVRLGAQDYILKPLDRIEDLLNPITRAIQHHRLILQNKTLTKELQESRDRLRMLNARLLEVEEAERRSLGTALHDHVAQDLAVLGINVGLALDAIPDRADDAKRSLEKTKEVLRQVVGSVRDVMWELLPHVLELFGLGAALREHGRVVAKRTGMPVTVEGDLGSRLQSREEVVLFRIAQEAVANAVKHAKAEHVLIVLSEDNGIVRLVVQDDGVGFDTKEARVPGRDGGWGLILMAERAASIGGRMEVLSEPGKGVRLTVEVGRKKK